MSALPPDLTPRKHIFIFPRSLSVSQTRPVSWNAVIIVRSQDLIPADARARQSAKVSAGEQPRVCFWLYFCHRVVFVVCATPPLDPEKPFKHEIRLNLVAMSTGAGRPSGSPREMFQISNFFSMEMFLVFQKLLEFFCRFWFTFKLCWLKYKHAWRQQFPTALSFSPELTFDLWLTDMRFFSLSHSWEILKEETRCKVFLRFKSENYFLFVSLFSFKLPQKIKRASN